MVCCSVVDPEPDMVGSALFVRIRIRIVTEKTDPGSIKAGKKRNKKWIISMIYNILKLV